MVRRSCAMAAPHGLHGFGLVEMMVSLVLGAIISLAAFGVLASTHAAYLRHGETTRLDASGRQALAIMVRAVRQAGYAGPDGAALTAAAAPATVAGPAAAAAPSMPASPAAPPAITGLDAATISKERYGIESPLGGAVNGSDVLAIRFTGSGSGEGDGSVTDCAGFAVGAGDEGWSIFYVATATDGEAELRCKYLGKSGWGADAVVRGVDTLQILYGIDTDDPADGIPNRYLNATQVNALGTDATGASWWKHVAAVRIALLLHGERASDPGAPATVHHLFGSGYSALAGRSDVGVQFDEKALPAVQRQRVRRLVGATVLVRNGGGA
jgi:type IV pilus assembly protein PilW